MRISLLYQGEYSQWREWFLNYLEEQIDGEAMIHSITHGEHLLPVVAQQNQGDVNDALGCKKRDVMVTSDPLALVAEKTKVTKRKEKVVVQSEFEGSDDDDISDLKKITALLAKAFNRKKFYAKPTNNNLRTSSASSSTNKKPKYMKFEEKKEDKRADCKKAKVKDYNYYKTKMLLAKKESDEQVLLAEDQAWMESSSDLDQEINANMVFMAKIEKNDDDQEIFHDTNESASENFNENHIESQIEHDESEVDHNDSEEKDHLVDKLINKFNQNIAKFHKRIERANQQSKNFENQNKELRDKYAVLKNQVNTFEEKNNEFNEQIKVLNETNVDLLAQKEVLQEQLKVKHVVIDYYTECQAQYAKLEEERYQYMIRYSSLCDNDKQHRKKIDEQEILFEKMSHQSVEMNYNELRLQEKIVEKETKFLNWKSFENPSYFCKAKDLRPSLYDKRVIGLGYTSMFLTHSNEALEIEKFERARDNKIEFAYDYGNLNATYVNEMINFLDDYFQEIINPDFEKIDSSFQQISSLKSYVLNVILEKIIIDLEDEVKVCDSEKNPNVIPPGMFKLSVSQSVSPISMTKTSCASNSVENLDTLSSVRRPKPSGVMWMKKGSSNTVKADLSSINHSNLNKNVRRYSLKNLMACNNSDTRSAFDCNNARNALCNARMNASVNVNDLFVFYD
nr:hypothetical protein [Tanacetum cinerariifolium]